jgi:hypothetical protein
MDTEEIVKLSRRAVANLIESRLASGKLESYAGHERRKSPRWPFPGQVEVRLLGDNHYPPSFFDCRDLGETGMGMCGEHGYEVGTVIELALHVPEVTFFGKGIVRYSMRTRQGRMMGVEFIFDE